MAKRKKEKLPVEENVMAEPPAGVPDKNLSKNIFSPNNRGILLDLLIFLTNLLLMRLLINLFLEVTRQAAAGDTFARIGLVLFYSGMLILPSLGAIFKRWHFHQDMKQRGQSEDDNYSLLGCIFIPFAYLAVNLFITLGVCLSLLDLFPSDSEYYDVSGITLMLGIPYNIIQTILVFRFFSPPKREPKSAFLRSPVSDLLGDACIFLNMIFYQLLLNWAVTIYPGFHEGKFIDRLIPLLVFAVLMYITGRIFFLVQDIHRPLSWLTILLANSLIILRALLDVR